MDRLSRTVARRRQERERGAATVEYVGIIIATAVLVIALVAMVPGARVDLERTLKQVIAPITSTSGSLTGSGW